jgi:FkbM family methyltransferase
MQPPNPESPILTLINKLERIPGFGPWIKRWYWKYIAWRNDPIPMIRKAVAGRDPVSVVVIGANDGVSADPVFPLVKANPDWRGTFVEPVPYLFEKLKTNYGHSERYCFVNAAVSDETKTLPFYYVSPEARRENPSFPAWVEQLGTFDKQIIAGLLEQRLVPYMVESEVRGISLSQLFQESHNEVVDVLVIDAEGADWRILRQLDLERYSPTVILFENCFLSKEDREAAKRFLSDRYSIRDLGKDYFCRLKG